MKKNNGLIYIVEIVIISLFISFTFYAFNGDFVSLILSFITYSIIVFFIKWLIFLNKINKYKLDLKKNFKSIKMEIKDYVFILLSPDYFLTKIMKNKLQNYHGDKSNKEIRKSYICSCNYFNVIVTLVLSLLYMLTFGLSCKEFNIVLYCIVTYRIISRCIEIILSFVKDVISRKEKQSNLKSENRIGLAFYSIFEICIFAFCTLLMDVEPNFNIFKALFESIDIIINNIANIDALEVKTLLVIEAIACNSLIGIVITTYISSTDACIDLDDKAIPCLKIYKGKEILIIPMNLLKNGNYELIVEEKDYKNHELEFNDIYGNTICLNSFNNRYLQLNNDGKYILKRNGKFTLELNSSNELGIYDNDI